MASRRHRELEEFLRRRGREQEEARRAELRASSGTAPEPPEDGEEELPEGVAAMAVCPGAWAMVMRRVFSDRPIGYPGQIFRLEVFVPEDAPWPSQIYLAGTLPEAFRFWRTKAWPAVRFWYAKSVIRDDLRGRLCDPKSDA